MHCWRWLHSSCGRCPATAQESTTDDPGGEEAAEAEDSGTEDDEEDDESEEDDDESEEEDDDGPNGAPPSNGRVTSEAGDLSGFLAPAVVSVDQQVTVHAVYQLHDHPGAGHGRPDHAGPPEGGEDDGDGEDTGSGRPGSAGPPEGVGPSFLQDDGNPDTGGTDAGSEENGVDEGDDTSDDTTDEESDEEGSDDDADEGDDESAHTGELCPASGDDTGGDAGDDAGDDISGDTGDDTSESPGDEPVDDGTSEEEPLEAAQAEDEGDAQDDDASTVEEGDDAEDDGDDAEDDGDDTEDEGDESDEDPRCLDVVFSVDYGDGTVEDMKPTKTRGADGSRRALGHHTYTAEGTYTVVITATPADGEPVSMELTAQVGAGEARLEGEDRISTAIRVSEESFPTDGSAGAVLLARADHFADALSAATLAFVEDAPVLLTSSAELPQAVIDEIGRALGEEGTVYLLGGEGAISAGVADALASLGYEVARLAGDDRIDTSLAIAEFLLAAGLEPTEIVVAAAGDYPDALSGAAYAAANDALVVLTDGTSLDPRVEALLSGLSTELEVVVAGGEAAISNDVVAALEALGFTVTRVEGENRFDTAVAMAERGYDGGDTVVLATGSDYPDALAGAVAAARRGAPVLLVGDVLPEAVAEFLAEHAETLDTLYVLGGAGAVPDSVVDAADELIDS